MSAITPELTPCDSRDTACDVGVVLRSFATRIERTTTESGGTGPAPQTDVTQEQIKDPGMNVKDFLWIGTLGALAAAGQVALMLFLVYFLLVADDQSAGAARCTVSTS